MEISRRNFFKFGIFSGLTSALPAWAKKAVLTPKEDAPPPMGEESFAYTICGLCPAGCGIRVRKVDGHAVGISGIPDHPTNQGGLCPKGAASLQELYHPDRLRTPLLRRGPRGSGEWKEISWDKAVRSLSEKITRARSGSKIKPLAALTRARAWDIQGEALRGLADSIGKDNFFALGFPKSEFPSDAYERMHGSRRVAFHMSRAKLLVSFGFDWLQSYPSPVEAQMAFAQLRRGPSGDRAEIVQIEPRFSVTAGKADQWVPVRPGTEGLLALILAKQLIANETYDKAFIHAQSRGFEDFKKSLDALSLDDVSTATEVPGKEIRLLAVKLSSLKPAAAITNRGPLLTQMAVHALNALLGNIGTGGVFSGMEGREGFWADGLADQSLQARPPELLLVDRVDPLFLSPSVWKEIVAKTPFVATVSSFLNETALSSDLVLPCHTPLERGHCSFHVSANGSAVLGAAPKAVAPLHETKDPGEIFLALTRALAGTRVPADFDSYVMSHMKKLRAEKLFHESSGGKFWREMSAAASGNPYATRSGKFEFDALTNLLKLQDVKKAREDGEFPLRLHLYAPLAFSFGEGAHLPYLQSVAGPQMQEAWETWAEMHPETASLPGLSDGEAIWVESRRGKIEARARLSRAAMPGVVSLPVGLGYADYGRWAKGLGSNPLEIGEEGTEVRLWKA
ncbi:MAG: molybdopterin-dependent oxidoreductase [Elusimicrobia bacterium]|nr:molybdopterin-dependent oxidoreductase [Elusimicrobiota bacterium]